MHIAPDTGWRSEGMPWLRGVAAKRSNDMCMAHDPEDIRQWLAHLRLPWLRRQTRCTMLKGWGMNSRSTKYVCSCEASKTIKQRAAMASRWSFSNTRLAQGVHLFTANITTRCVPSAWPQGLGVHLRWLPKGGDTGDCANYRPLTLLPVVDKLFAKLLSERISRDVCLHDQQYACFSGRGTLNPMQKLLAVVQQRTQANKPMYACFCYASKAHDSVPHAVLLHRLLHCGVEGPVLPFCRPCAFGMQQGACWVGPVPCL